MKKEEIKTLQDLCDYINENEDYPIGIEELINEKGWITLSGEECVCYDPLSKENDFMVVINDDGKAETCHNLPYTTYEGEKLNYILKTIILAAGNKKGTDEKELVISENPLTKIYCFIDNEESGNATVDENKVKIDKWLKGVFYQEEFGEVKHCCYNISPARLEDIVREAYLSVYKINHSGEFDEKSFETSLETFIQLLNW